MHPTQWSRATAVGGPVYPTPYQETGAPPRAFAMRPPFAGHGGQLLNWSLATTTKKYFIQRNQYIFASPWHEEEPAPAQTSRTPPCLPHGLSAEGIGSQATMSARMKSLFREYLGQSSISVLPPKTNDKNYIGTMTSYPLRPRFPLIHTFFLCFPRRKIEFAIEPYAIYIRLLPRKRLHRQQAM